MCIGFSDVGYKRGVKMEGLRAEAQAMREPFRLRLTPLAEWLERTADYLKPDKAWAVNAFASKA